jgi:WS/DGAT/MGAT family acyltransferase
MSEHLTALDATFLELEQVDETAHMHIGAIMVFDPPPDGAAPSLEALCRHLESRLDTLPRYSQRLSQLHTGGLSWPEWVTDPAFDVRRHLSRAALPAPGGDDELAEWASGFFSQRLDRHRPLWEMVLVEGLAGGRWALASKTHHCMVDGVGSVDVGHVLLDAEATPQDPPHARMRPDASSKRSADAKPAGSESKSGGGTGSPLSRLWPSLVSAGPLRDIAEAGAHSFLHPLESLAKARGALGVVIDEELHPAPHTSLNDPIGTRRRFEVVHVPLDEVRAIKDALGGTVNDVVLTLTASGLRDLLVSREEALPDKGLRAMVPMNIRLAGERLALGNKISSLFLDLPVGEPDLGRRYKETVARSRELKSDGAQAAATTSVIELTGLAPPFVHSALAQALYATKLFNVTVTNVPGPQQTLYVLGSPLREVHPLVPLAAEHAVGVAVVSYDGGMYFGIVADPDTVPDLEVMLEGMHAARDGLLAMARLRNRRRGATREGSPAVSAASGT